MTDIFSSILQFLLWSSLYLGTKFEWGFPVRLIIFGPLMVLLILDLIAPFQFEVADSIGRPLSMGLRLATLGITILFLIRMFRDRDRPFADAR